MTRVKICGLSNLDDARQAQAAGADLLGFVLADAPRGLAPDDLAAMLEELEPGAARVGVFRDQDPAFVSHVAELCELDYVQLHGSEPASTCAGMRVPVIKAFPAGLDPQSIAVAEFQVAIALVEERGRGTAPAGGQGKPWDYSQARRWVASRQVLLAGGLDPSSVGAVVESVRPWGVDVSSGVEGAEVGVKDHGLVSAFIAAVRRADARLHATPVLARETP